jgi:hypothetical protein
MDVRVGSYAYDRGAGTVTFPDQYGVRIGKGVYCSTLCSPTVP